jgi:two-component system, cell cycle sensor histidine kinase and response regulator CckA
MVQETTMPKQEPATVYVVEDEKALLQLVRLTLAGGPWCVKGFASGEEALRSFAAEERKPALLVTDYDLGTTDGLSLAVECRRLQPQLKIILMSGTVTSEVVATSPVDLECFIPKPFRVHQLREAVSSVLAEP